MEGRESRRWVKELEAQSSRKPHLAFSIDNILGRGNSGDSFQTSNVCSIRERRPRSETFDAATVIPPDLTSAVRLPWLSYTRYSPPKLPSKCWSLVILFFRYPNVGIGAAHHVMSNWLESRSYPKFSVLATTINDGLERYWLSGLLYVCGEKCLYFMAFIYLQTKP